jgi:hypothetical protein
MENQIQIDIKEDVMFGVYSNLSIISHSPTEFVFDFVQLIPNASNASVRSRVILAPENAKRFLSALKDNIKKYEDSFGRIKDNDTPPVYSNNNDSRPPGSV